MVEVSSTEMVESLLPEALPSSSSGRELLDNGNREEQSTKDNKVTTFEDLMALVGTQGPWNIRIILICAFNSFVMPFSSMSYQFYGSTPDHWCQVPQLEVANWTRQQIFTLAIPFSNSSGKPEGCLINNYNYTAAAHLGYETTMANASVVVIDGENFLPCHARDYNTSHPSSSVVVEFDLTCERRFLYSTTQAITQLGMFVGSVCFGYLLDSVGRRKVVLTSSVLSIITSFLIIAAPDVGTYIGLKLLYQICEMGMYMGCLIITMEICSSIQRTMVGSLYLLPWALGYMIVPCIAYLVRPWRWLQFAVTIPLFYTLNYFWLLPESPRWLILRGHFKKALRILKQAAAINRASLPPDDVILAFMNNIRQMESSSDDMDEESRPSNLKEGMRRIFLLVVTPEVRVKALVIFYIWAATGMIYYGVSLSSYNLSTNIYLHTFLGALMEIPAYLFLWLALTKLGRRKTLAVLYLLCGATIFILTALMLVLQEVPVGVKIVMSLSGKMAITAAFCLIWFYTTEIFSTKYRSRAIGEASTFCRIGSASSPYINDLLGELVVWGPSAVFSLVAVVAALLVLILPETTNKKMPQKN